MVGDGIKLSFVHSSHTARKRPSMQKLLPEQRVAAGRGGQIGLSICLHRVFKMQFPIRLSIFRRHLSAFISLWPCCRHPAEQIRAGLFFSVHDEAVPRLYNAAAFAGRVQALACTSPRTHTRNAVDRAALLSNTRPLLFMHVCAGQVDVY